MTEAGTAAPKTRLLRQPAFLRFWAARSCATVGFQIMAVVVGWQVYALTSSTFELGLVGLMQFMPMLLLTVPAGHVADRYDRRIVVRVCQAVEGSAALALAVGNVEGWLSTHVIFAVVAVFGAARTFENPSTQSLLPGIVSATTLPSALALSTSAIQTATIVGPALGGALYLWGPAAAYATVAALYLTAGVLMGGIAMQRAAPRREPVSVASLLSGFVFIREHPIVLGAISLDLFAVLLGGATALLPVFARDILHTNAIGLGTLRTAPAVGALLTSLILARRPLGRHVGRVMFTAVVLFGLGTIVFGLSRSYPLSLAALALMGASDVVSVVIRSSLVQLGTPDAMRGRVSAVNSMFIGTSNQLGEFESGVTASLLGAVPAVVLGGLGTVAVALAWSRLFPGLRGADTLAAPGP